ncbi:MAG: hypothetical protein ACI9MR_001801 [Myxococcota bacterium]|jgi:hypothetical protein
MEGSKKHLFVGVALAGLIAVSTWAVFQITTDISILTYLGIAGGAVGAITLLVALKKMPSVRWGLVGGALVGAGLAALLSYQTFFAINDEAFVQTAADSAESQDALDAAFDDDDF